MDAGLAIPAIIGAVTGTIGGAIGGSIATFVDGWFSPIARMWIDWKSRVFSAKVNVTGGTRGGAFVGTPIGAVTAGLGSLTLGIAVVVAFAIVVLALLSRARGKVPLRTWLAMLLGGGLGGAITAFVVNRVVILR